MGDYTQLDIKLKVKPEVRAIITALYQTYVDTGKWSTELLQHKARELNLDHPFFSKMRLTYFIEIDGFESDTKWKVSVDLKNYEQEIETFLDWVKPFMLEADGAKIGEKTLPTMFMECGEYDVYWRNGDFEFEKGQENDNEDGGFFGYRP